MNTKDELLAWAKKILAKGTTAPAHELLGVRANVDPVGASDAFMKIARTAHPDLHRNSLNETEFDQLVLAYSRVAGAYQELRTARRTGTTAAPPMGEASRSGTTNAPPMGAARAGASTAAPPSAQQGPAGAMNAKALVYFRKAEIALNKGDLRAAILQLKMGIAADPQSAVLRTALSQVEAELKKPAT